MNSAVTFNLTWGPDLDMLLRAASNGWRIAPHVREQIAAQLPSAIRHAREEKGSDLRKGWRITKLVRLAALVLAGMDADQRILKPKRKGLRPSRLLSQRERWKAGAEPLGDAEIAAVARLCAITNEEAIALIGREFTDQQPQPTTEQTLGTIPAEEGT